MSSNLDPKSAVACYRGGGKSQNTAVACYRGRWKRHKCPSYVTGTVPIVWENRIQGWILIVFFSLYVIIHERWKILFYCPMCCFRIFPVVNFAIVFYGHQRNYFHHHVPKSKSPPMLSQDHIRVGMPVDLMPSIFSDHRATVVWR